MSEKITGIGELSGEGQEQFGCGKEERGENKDAAQAQHSRRQAAIQHEDSIATSTQTLDFCYVLKKLLRNTVRAEEGKIPEATSVQQK